MKNLQLVFAKAKKTLQKKQTSDMTYMKPSPPKRDFGSVEDEQNPKVWVKQVTTSLIHIYKIEKKVSPS